MAVDESGKGGAVARLGGLDQGVIHVWDLRTWLGHAGTSLRNLNYVCLTRARQASLDGNVAFFRRLAPHFFNYYKSVF